ncbi:MAG: sigma-70 family RNA polymerase sigma factor [Candidatus Solibacter sp.]
MAGDPRSLVLPFLGRLVQGKRASSPFTELEAEIIGLFDQMRGRILRYSLSFGLPVADAEEIVQEAFLALYRHLLRERSREGLTAWLFRVTHNLSLKRRAAIARSAAGPLTQDTERETLPIADPQPNPEEQLAFRQRQDRLRSVVRALPEMDRECLYLRSEGLRYRAIAEVLGISTGSVANSLMRSLARLSAANERLG